MARYLIDTDVMIDVSRGGVVAATFIDSLEDLTISIITAHELIVGARNQRDAATAIAEGFTLVSRNRKHFQMIGDLSLEVPSY